ncbi:formyltetrahydrofolate-dependent phosphoribosylglycinamide formyltransferase [Geosporobacter subterraneus DSM 17957]|uniref:Phosphoribosylglycinamide formyltransferase n=1 Tax=Geosporobacter subterraneus DSM 17957 TaxID=1121919 RepID=A0A1M6LA76_9FIRM|nr:phosphoribosylglycinamide formyltransferase [Geosporobacter subterraneus]SHJ68039.1 formyltetrahydrofolate-dependent phosphoribosylglycinamide formyltransferase [Geosporobacter subterraneus DSM 17957]
MSKIRIAVLVSGGGTNLQAVIDQIERGNIPAVIEMVISNRKDAYALERARRHGIESIYIGSKNFPNLKERNYRLEKILEERKIDLIILAGYMQILEGHIIEKYRNRIINIHPSLIPSFCGQGFYGEYVHRAVLEYGVKLTGATVHFVDEGADTGPVILQKAVEVQEEDTVESLAKRVLTLEHELLPLAVKLFAEGRLMVEGRKVRIKGGYSIGETGFNQCIR